jgi:glyoxylase-like metal-dependent hydrolase (beta-lactamase superfamily II)
MLKKAPIVFAAALVLAALPARAQGNDFSKVEIKPTKVAGSVWMLQGAGGNIGVSSGPDGLLIVDDQFLPLADKIKAALKGIAKDGKLAFVVNTHWHGDHTGGNLVFGKDATIIPGHGPLGTLSDLKKFHAMLLGTTGVVKDEIAKGMTLDEAKKAGLPDEWKRYASDFITVDKWVETIYTNLKK